MALCILTNQTALLSPPASANHRHIQIMRSDHHKDSEASIQEYHRVFTELESKFREILVLTPPESIASSHSIARQAAQSHGGTARISVLNTNQIGISLGMLVHLAARKAEEGLAMRDVEEYLRAIMPFLFTLILCDGPQPINNPEQPGQKSEAEKPMPTQIFLLEDGELTPYKKVRTQRHILEIFQDFLSEFETPQSLVYFHGKSAGLHTRHIRETASTLYPASAFSSIELSPGLIEIWGENSAGLAVIETPARLGVQF